MKTPDTVTLHINGRPLSIRGMFRLRVRGGQVCHRVDYWDGAEVERQIGDP